MTLLSIENLKTHFITPEGVVKAVNKVSFDILENEKIGLIGESGCGKSVLALSIMRLLFEDNSVVKGNIWYNGNNLLDLEENAMRQIRGKEIAQIFQNPSSSLNPVLTVGLQIAEPFIHHENMQSNNAWDKAVSMLKNVKISSPMKRAKEYPHQFSGGMKQRAMIAMGLACDPRLIIADEPTKGLDVTIQAQIVTLMKELLRENKSALVITHDLAVAFELCDKIAVMYSGEIVESSPVEYFFKKPNHPYCESLMLALPSNGMKPIPGNSPSLINIPQGCRFSSRCSYAMERCISEHPELYNVHEGVKVRCFLYA